jgi:FtsZ-binding cell division protein ZapB
MTELEELTHKIHAFIAQIKQLHGENEKLKHENEELKYGNKELVFQLERIYNENEILKRELDAMCEKLKMMEMQSALTSISEPVRDSAIKCNRIRPYDADEVVDEDRERKKGGKKTSL